ncbi:hypothetical protein KIN20_023833 [Parelaphostrongylus tenuis]|uniref:Acyltransferase n=1 Tax=Parelaphostrongylus tenuis TaxID=148309 RepID=A0AAD5N6Y2_PARTN|nr:hypothetical protein KIN20_023833 [Parelaphostrongylus tenuis]
MELNREQKRLLMLHEYKVCTNAADTVRLINEAWDEGTVGKTAVYDHFKEFKAGNESLSDKPRLGRSREVDCQAVLDRIEECPSQSSRMLRDEIFMSPDLWLNRKNNIVDEDATHGLSLMQNQHGSFSSYISKASPLEDLLGRNVPVHVEGISLRFFVLSGFLMSMMLERKKRLGSQEIMQFYYRRIRRILPSYILIILLSLMAARLMLIRYLQVNNLESGVYALTFTTNIKAADSIRNYLRMTSKASDLFTHTWSIAVEMQFYLLVPIIFIIYKSAHGTMGILFLIIIGSTSLLFHVILPTAYAFNMVYARLWQFILGILVQQCDRNSVHTETTKNFRNGIVHRIHLLLTLAYNFDPNTRPHVKNRIVCTFLTAGLILFHSTERSSVLSSRCFIYVGKLSYSLYLVHWPIFIIIKTQFPDNKLSISVIMSIVLTECFEKAYLRASPKTLFSLIIGLYAIVAIFYLNEWSKDDLANDTKWIAKLFTPVCPDKILNYSDTCDIPFYRMNFSAEQIIQINEWSSLDDENQLFYKKCFYTDNFSPWGWCDLSPKNHISTHKILVLGNSYATNQGRIVYESCRNSDTEVRVYSQPGCEVLTETTEYVHCQHSRRLFYKVVREYEPNVLFILTRHTQLIESLKTTAETVVDNAAAILNELSRIVTDRIFVLNAIPIPTRTFEHDHTVAMRAGKVLDQEIYLNKTLNLEMVRQTVRRIVSLCSKCRVIDYAQVFAVNGTFHMFDDQTQLAYLNGYWHFTHHGLNQLRPFFKRICDEISYTNPSKK